MQDQGQECVQTKNLARIPGYQIVSSHVDGTAKSGKTLAAILDGEVCTESEFPTSGKTFRDMQRIVDSLKDYSENRSFAEAAIQTRAEAQLAQMKLQMLQKKIAAGEKKLNEFEKHNEYFKNTLEILSLKYQLYLEKSELAGLRAYLNNGIDRLSEHQNKMIQKREQIAFAAIKKILNDDLKRAPKETSSPALKKCLGKSLQFDSKRPGTEKDILSLLNAKRPVLCSGNVEGIGYHETLIVGYRRNRQGKIDYLLRDSQMAAYVWGMKFECDEILWMH